LDLILECFDALPPGRLDLVDGEQLAFQLLQAQPALLLVPKQAGDQH
jgi:hypothetical protein